MPAPGVRLYLKSCESMTELRDGEVSLSVTSPPYWNAIDYERHSQQGEGAWYRTRNYAIGFREYAGYLDFMERVYREVFRVTKPGGFACLVIGTVLYKKRHLPVPYDVTHALCDLGWEFHQDIIWHKCTAGVKRAGVMIQRRQPGYFYPNIMTEYILVFRKPGEPIYRTSSPSAKQRSEIEINRVFVCDTANNIWHIAPVPPGYLDHPCPFPEELPYRLVSLYSLTGDVVLDPFVGSGQTLKLAVALGRRAVGYDIQEEYIALARKRMGEPLKLRPEQLIARFDKVQLDAPLKASSSSAKPARSRARKVSRVAVRQLAYKKKAASHRAYSS